MATVVRLQEYGNQVAVIFDDGSRVLAHPGNGNLWHVDTNTNGVVTLQPFGNLLVVNYDNATKDIGYPASNGLFYVHGTYIVIPPITWIWPVHYKSDGVTKWHLGDGFGPRINPVTGLPEVHPGQDINGAGISGWPIVAPSHGIVQGVGTTPSASYGYNVRMSHDDGTGTLCAHMISSPPVSVGQEVYPGDVIGFVGATGEVTGTHLHYNTQDSYSPSVNANVVDPLGFMADRGSPW